MLHEFDFMQLWKVVKQSLQDVIFTSDARPGKSEDRHLGRKYGSKVLEYRNKQIWKHELEPTGTDWNLGQFLWSLSLIDWVSYRRQGLSSYCKHTHPWLRSQRSWRRSQVKMQSGGPGCYVMPMKIYHWNVRKGKDVIKRKCYLIMSLEYMLNF